MAGETPLDLIIDETFVSRLLLGALSEHEQRMLTVWLARSNPEFCASLRSILEPFELFDGDLAREYSAALTLNPGKSDSLRREILARSFARAEDLETLLRELTVNDVMALGEVTRKLFSWSMAELLLERGLNSTKEHQAQTSLYLASMITDVIEILGATGHSPYFANVIGDVRRRIRQAAEQTSSPQAKSLL